MNADMAMYEAKEGSRGPCRVFSREMVGRSKDRLSLSVQIDAALTRFQINCIKLDRAFVDRIGKDTASEEVIRSLLQLAARLKLRVVAEGVEQQGQQNFLAGAGCDLMQGFHLVRPMSGAALPDWLAAHGHTRAVEAVDA